MPVNPRRPSLADNSPERFVNRHSAVRVYPLGDDEPQDILQGWRLHEAPVEAGQDPAIAERQRSGAGLTSVARALRALSGRDTRPYECDGLALYRSLPPVVVLPETEEQVIAVLRLCKASTSPLWRAAPAQGCRAAPCRMRKAFCWAWQNSTESRESSLESATAVVEPGVRNLAISEAAAPYGLYYAPDPSSQIACSIGGNVAENSGGVHCLKYGLTVHNVLRVRMVTIDGDVVELGSEAPDCAGPGFAGGFHRFGRHAGHRHRSNGAG